MKKIISILACICILLSAMVITVSAADSTETEIVLTVDSLGLESNKYTAASSTVDGVGFEWIQLGNYGDGIQVRDKNDNPSTFWNTTAFSTPIKEIKLVYSSTKDVQYANPDAEIFSFGNAVDSYTYSTKLSTTAGVKEYTITPDAETYTFLKFEHDLGYSMYWDSITIVLAAGSTGGNDTTGGDTTGGDTTGGEVNTPDADEPTTEETKTNNIVLTVDSLGLPAENYNAEEATGTVGGVDFSWIQLGNYGAGIQVRDKDGKTSSFWNTTAFAAPIKEIKLVFNSEKKTYDNPDAEIFSFGNEAGTYTYETKLSTVADQKEYTITPDAETYTFLKFEHDLGYSMYWDSIEIVLVGGTTPEKDDTTTTDKKDDATTSTDNKTEDKKDDATEDKGGEESKEEAKEVFGVVEQPVAGTAYKFGMVQGNLKKTLYLTGEMDGFYMATTEDATKAADVYLEETEGGYYIYAMVNGAKKYMNIVEAQGTDGKTHINATFDDKAISVYTYNTTVKTYVTKVGDKEYGFGTRNDKEYTTISPSSTEYTDNFFCHFYGMTKGGTSPATGDSVGSVVALTMAAAAVILYTSKKR